MNKKIVSTMLAAAIMCGSAGAVMAADNNPLVRVNNREIVFADQKPVIVEGENRTMVPARGIFEYMGAKVEWNEEKQLVKIEKGNYEIHITIGNEIMTVYTYSPQALLAAPKKEEIKLDAVPRIMNDRTMIPLRAISESLKADVDWNEQANAVEIVTSDYKALVSDKKDETSGDNAQQEQKAIKLSLSTSSSSVKKDETVDVIVNVANLPEGAEVSALSVGIIYDQAKFEYVEGSMKTTDEELSGNIGGVNDKFSEDSLKAALVFMDSNKYIKQDGQLVKFTFKALSDEKAEFRLSDRHLLNLGVDTMLTLEQDGKLVSVNKDLVIDTTAVEIN